MKNSVVAVALIGLQASCVAFAEHHLDDSLAFEHMIPIVMNSPEEIKDATKHFNDTLGFTKTEGEISECGKVIYLHVGITDGNTSYGSICTYRKADEVSNVFICDDDMVGHLFITPDYTDTDQWWIDAIGQHCVGG